ncbi:unnamed protein product [Arabidopsis halleri]
MSISTQIDVEIMEPAPEKRAFVDRIALVVSKKGSMLESKIKACNENNAKFSFLWSSDSCHAFYQRRLTEYRAQNQDGAQPDDHECVQDAPRDLESPPSRYSPIRPFRDLAFTFPAGMTPHDFGIIKLTALFVARWGPYFSLALMKRVDKNPQFAFLRSTGSMLNFYLGLVGAYSRVLSHSEKVSMATVLKVFFDKVKMSTVMLHAFISGVDCFAYMDNADYSAVMPPPERFSMILDRLKDMQPPLVSDTPSDISCPIPERWRPAKDLGILNFTAQFVARYGPYFCLELKEAVDKNPQFVFMKPTDNLYDYYSGCVDAYSNVFTDLARLDKGNASTAVTVLKVFFQRLQLEKLQEGDDMAIIDLHAFLGGVNFFADMEDKEYSANLPPPEHLSVMLNRITDMQPSHPRPCDQLALPSAVMVQPAPPMPGMSPRVPEEPEPKRHKF